MLDDIKKTIPLITKDTKFSEWINYEAKVGRSRFPNTAKTTQAWEEIQKRVLENGSVDMNPPPTVVTKDTTFSQWINAENACGRARIANAGGTVRAWEKIQEELKQATTQENNTDGASNVHKNKM